MKDHNSTANQDIKREFVSREVFGCFTAEVEYILSRWDYNDAPFSYDDVEHLYMPYCTDCGEGYINFSQEEDEDGFPIYVCDDCGRRYSEDDYRDLDTQEAEIYEWWAVSGFLAKKLAARGECVIDGPCAWYWGRCATGQAILLDYVISCICEEMGILDGQPNSWAKLPA